MRLRLLDRYVLSELLYPFIFGIASFFQTDRKLKAATAI